MARWRAACVLVAAAGCTTLSNDPLSPPHLRRASQHMHDTKECMKCNLSCEHQQWLADVRHFCSDTYCEFEYEYHKNNDWPFPYDVLARESLYQPINQQAENARLQVLSVWDYHFEPTSGRLNAMGRKRLESIVDQASELGRVVYVRRTQNRTETLARVAAVREELRKMAQDTPAFEVVEASAMPSFVSGGEAQKTIKLLTNPAKSESGSESSSGSGFSGTGK
jgi:hypothetical protein